jgi:hypothetical protein
VRSRPSGTFALDLLGKDWALISSNSVRLPDLGDETPPNWLTRTAARLALQLSF